MSQTIDVSTAPPMHLFIVYLLIYLFVHSSIETSTLFYTNCINCLYTNLWNHVGPSCFRIPVCLFFFFCHAYKLPVFESSCYVQVIHAIIYMYTHINIYIYLYICIYVYIHITCRVYFPVCINIYLIYPDKPLPIYRFLPVCIHI